GRRRIAPAARNRPGPRRRDRPPRSRRGRLRGVRSGEPPQRGGAQSLCAHGRTRRGRCRDARRLSPRRRRGGARRPMKTLLAGALSFGLFSALPSGALSFALYLNRRSVPDATGDLLLALYLVGLTAALTAAGFVIPIALDRRWHGLAWRR